MPNAECRMPNGSTIDDVSFGIWHLAFGIERSPVQAQERQTRHLYSPHHVLRLSLGGVLGRISRRVVIERIVDLQLLRVWRSLRFPAGELIDFGKFVPRRR